MLFARKKKETKEEQMRRAARARLTDGEGISISYCAWCLHKHSGGATCEAFPEGIPMDILTNKVLHNKPIAFDKGYLFTPYVESEIENIRRVVPEGLMD